MVDDEDFFVLEAGLWLLQGKQYIQVDVIPISQVVRVKQSLKIGEQILSRRLEFLFQLVDFLQYFRVKLVFTHGDFLIKKGSIFEAFLLNFGSVLMSRRGKN